MASVDGRNPIALPVACSLDLADGAERARRWQLLISRTPPLRLRRGRLFEMRFQNGPGVREELEALADAEARCCRFVDWTVVVGEDQLVLQVTAPQDKPEDIEAIVAAFDAAGSSAES